MNHNNIECRVLEKTWVTETVFRIRFEPIIPFEFKEGQFLTISVPIGEGTQEPERRCYSFGSSLVESQRFGYELYVRFVPGGVGTEFLAALTTGDSFFADGPFGQFQFRRPVFGRNVCFICTSSATGVFKSMVGSREFRQSPPLRTFLLMGARNEKEILFSRYLESRGVEVIPCVSAPQSEESLYFKGHVTQYLEMQKFIDMHATDFYICGAEKMVTDVVYHLRFERNVARSAVFTENFRSNLVAPPLVTGRRLIPLRELRPERNGVPLRRKAA